MHFEERFPQTAALLEQARQRPHPVFSDYSAGIHLGDPDRAHRYVTSAPQNPGLLFDLASLTKVLCTTTLCLIAEKKGLISAADPVQFFFADFPSDRVTLSHLLNHSSGLPAYLDLHAEFHEPDGPGRFDGLTTPIAARARYEERILESWDAVEFEKQCVYSDLGFMLLGWALEKATRASLDDLFQEWVAHPCKLESLQFLPTSPEIAPTENCPWRGRVLRGEVHDDNCYVLGGVAGHAGLFGGIHDVLALAQLWLEGREPLDKSLVHRYWHATHVPGSAHVLGWDGVSAANSSAGRFFSKESRGHLGYTGTSLWIDPQRKLIVSLLTNRVHPTRRNEAIKEFRPEFHDALMRELGFDTH